MTGRDLISHVCLLGARTPESFDEEFQYDHIYGACNRAISEVNKLFPVVRYIKILNFPIKPKVYHAGITIHRGGSDVTIKASDIKSLAFAVSGTGKVKLYSQGLIDAYGESNMLNTFETSWQDVTNFKTIKIFPESVLIPPETGEQIGIGEITLTFGGEFSYMIKDISFYDELEGPLEGDVDIYSEWVSYDLGSDKYLSKKFLGLAAVPIRCYNSSAISPDDYRIERNVIFLKADKEGEYEIECYIKPVEIDADNLDAEIDLDTRVHDMAALRAAQYIYAIADEEAAAHCKQEFERLMSISYSTMPMADTAVQFRDLRGW